MSEAKVYWNKGWYGITDDHRARWRKAYPAVKIDTELAAMDQWLWANPSRRKKNYPCFIVNWLKRCQNDGSTSSRPAHCSGNYRAPKALTPAEIEERVAENRLPGGACDQIGALLSELKKGQTKNQSDPRKN